MSKIYCFLLIIFLAINVTAQNKSGGRSGIRGFGKSTKTFKERVDAINNKWKVFVGNFKENKGSISGGINFSRQVINTNSFSSIFNYDLNGLNNNDFKSGFSLGYKFDGIYKSQRPYSLSLKFNEFRTGTKYQSSSTLEPFIGTFSNFKANNKFFTIEIAPHFKRLVQITDTSKYKFYVVAGPDLHVRLSKQSLDNKVIQAYRNMMLRGDVGLEFDNNGFYTIYLYYHLPITSFTASPIRSRLSTIEFGTTIRFKDLF